MTLQPGARLGPYEVVAHVGSGGMGEVYKARDTRLDRTVAIKVLPPHVLDDPGFRARFEREARTASSLDHPNICTLYDVGREADVEYLVMQYLDGGTLAQRLARGPLPIDEALRHAAEIAGALDKAHRAGILHRDIKPGNVMLVKAGRESSAKLLDFGLAKAVAPLQLDVAATATSPITGRGQIVGTLQYMSPEQLEGRELDARSDIFSFGAMLYEMVTGRRAFEGGSEASLIAAILDRDPAPMASVAPLAPPALDRLVRKCLAKDRERRWQSAADLADELAWIAQSSGVQQPVHGSQRSGLMKYVVPAAAAVLIVGVVAGIVSMFVNRAREAPAGVARQFAIALPEGLTVRRGGVALSPDGQTIAFVGGAAQSVAQLYVRRINAQEVTAVDGIQNVRNPFFSSDGQSIGYFSGSRLMRVSLRGGRPAKIADVPPVNRGGVWLPDDSIVISPMQTGGLVRIAQDGSATPLTTVETAQGERAHLWPSLLPGGGDILFAILRGTTYAVDATDVAVVHVASGERRVVYRGGAFPRYSPTGHLLFVRGGALQAVPFDLASKTTSGAAMPVAENVAVDAAYGGAHYAVAPDGALLLFRGAFPRPHASAVWVDASGTSSPVPGLGMRMPRQPRISPDGTRALFDAESPDGDYEIYVLDTARGTAVRLRSDPQDDFNPVWTPDGRRVVWTVMPASRLPFLVIGAADGTGAAEPILPANDGAQFAGSVSSSNVLAYTQANASGTRDIWVVPLEGERKPRPFVATAAVEYGPQFSPDGNWIAYVSHESGTPDVYVAPYPGPGGTRRVTSGGAASPTWSRDGGTLFYQTDEGIFAVGVSGAPDIRFGAPRRLFTGSFVIDSREDGPRAYDVSPDGKRFLMLVRDPVPPSPISFHVLLNWVNELKR